MTALETRPALPVEPHTRQPRPPLPAATGLVLWVLAAVSGVALWGAVYPVAIGSLQEQHSQARLFDRFRSELSQATAPLGPTKLGKPVALVAFSRAGLNKAVVVEGTSSRQLQDGPGHRRDSVLPGQVGTSVLLGKAVTFGGPFGSLHDARVGDVITVTTGQGVFRYSVERVRRPGDSLPPALATGQSRLVLGSAEGPGWRNRIAPTSVVYVDALLATGAQPAPGGRTTVLPQEEQVMQPMTEPLFALVLWLQALVLFVVAVMWLRSRWGHWQAWAVGLPLLLAVVVGASGTATQLLPNLL